jgi:hypothetical protein
MKEPGGLTVMSYANGQLAVGLPDDCHGNRDHVPVHPEAEGVDVLVNEMPRR